MKKETKIEKLPTRILIPNGEMAKVITKSGKMIEIEKSDSYALMIYATPLKNMKWEVFYKNFLNEKILIMKKGDNLEKVAKEMFEYVKKLPHMKPEIKV